MAVAAAVLSLAATSAILWQHGANETERADQAEALLGETRKELRSTTSDLKDTKTKLDASTTANNDLTRRVSELGNEKSQVQDERNAAQEVSRLAAKAAAEMQECRDRVLDAAQMVLYDIVEATAILEAATPICQQANSDVAAFTGS